MKEESGLYWYGGSFQVSIKDDRNVSQDVGPEAI